MSLEYEPSSEKRLASVLTLALMQVNTARHSGGGRDRDRDSDRRRQRQTARQKQRHRVECAHPRSHAGQLDNRFENNYFAEM